MKERQYMQKFEFELILANELTDSEFDQAYEAGFDDSTFGVSNNIPTVLITREDETFVDAVVGAINQLEKTTTAHVINTGDAEDIFKKSPNVEHKRTLAAINAHLDARRELSYLPPQVAERIKALII